jgi:Family of unknown function (DUF6262)
MSRADNTHYLRVAAQARHDHALQRAHEAIRALDRRGEPITFTAVATTAHVSRAWLYRQPELRAVIAGRPRTRPRAIPAAQRATAESNNARLDALRLEIEHLAPRTPPRATTSPEPSDNDAPTPTRCDSNTSTTQTPCQHRTSPSPAPGNAGSVGAFADARSPDERDSVLAPIPRAEPALEPTERRLWSGSRRPRPGHSVQAPRALDRLVRFRSDHRV